MRRSDVERQLRPFLRRLRRDAQTDILAALAQLERALARAQSRQPARPSPAVARAALVALGQDFLSIHTRLVTLITGRTAAEYVASTTSLFRKQGLTTDSIEDLFHGPLERLQEELTARRRPSGQSVPRLVGKYLVRANRELAAQDPREVLESLRAPLRRILITEGYEAMRRSTALANQLSPIIRIAKWTVSDQHASLPSSPDVCDLLASQDNGFGKGWYPLDQWPSLPHPHCGCYAGRVRAFPSSEWFAQLQINAAKVPPKKGKAKPSKKLPAPKRPPAPKKIRFRTHAEAEKFFRDELGIGRVSIDPRTDFWLLEDVATELREFKLDGYPMIPSLIFEDRGPAYSTMPAAWGSAPGAEYMIVNITSPIYAEPDILDEEMLRLHQAGHFSSDDPGHIFAHEFGHFLHDTKLKSLNLGYLGAWARYAMPQSPPRTWRQQYGLLPGDITRLVSRYGEWQGDPAEFVTEVFTGMLNGKTYPKEIMDAYKGLHGPELLG